MRMGFLTVTLRGCTFHSVLVSHEGEDTTGDKAGEVPVCTGTWAPQHPPEGPVSRVQLVLPAGHAALGMRGVDMECTGHGTRQCVSVRACSSRQGEGVWRHCAQLSPALTPFRVPKGQHFGSSQGPLTLLPTRSPAF